MWKSAGGEDSWPERVRFGILGKARGSSGSTLAFDLITDLNVPLDSRGGTMRSGWSYS